MRSRTRANKEFDTSGKSPENIHHRKNFKSPQPGNRLRAFSIGLSKSDGGSHVTAPLLTCIA
jgi:hypothetical protein